MHLFKVISYTTDILEGCIFLFPFFVFFVFYLFELCFGLCFIVRWFGVLAIVCTACGSIN